MINIPEVSVEVLKTPTSIHELFYTYRLSDEYNRLAAKSRKEYNYYANALLNSVYATKSPEFISPNIAGGIYKNLKDQHSVAFANMFCRVWSVIYSFAQSKGWVVYNPWKVIKKDPVRSRKIVWTQEQVYAMVQEALEIDVPFAKAVMLLYETGQRPADVLLMSYNHLVKDDNGWYVKLYQKKTDNWVQPAITNETRDLLTIDLGLVASDKLIGVEWTQQDLQYAFKKMRKKLGLSDKLQLRDLRRTALTEAGAGGATDDQMKAHSGHSSRDMLDIYSVSGRKKALEAHNARFKKDGH